MIRARATAWLGIVVVSGVTAGCGGGGGGTPATAPPTASVPSGPATLTVGVGGVDPGHPERDLLAFYPSTLSAHPGDTLRLANPTQETPHTVTFGVLPDHSNQPQLIAPGVGFTPIAGGPCVSTQPVTAAATTCPGAPAAPPPAPAGTPAPEVTLPAPFAGQPFYNSGIFVGGQTAVLQLAPTLAPGAYRFICMLHPTMAATLTVVAAGKPIESSAALTAAAARAVTADIADAARAAGSVPAPPAGTVQAGAMGRELTVNQFFPQTVTVSAGQPVTWRDANYEPHVIVFGRQITPDDPLVFGGPNPAPGSSYTTELAVSGLIGAKPFASSTYALTFPTAGTYQYICAIHPGMAGTVVVR